MKEFIMLLSLMTIILLAILKSTFGYPVSDEEQLYVPTKPHSSNVKSIFVGSNGGILNNDNAMNKIMKKKRATSKQNLPPSPAGLLRPDTFQFYTFNQNGEVVMKQMSKKEIESLIASSGDHFPMKIYESQKVDAISPSETKVSDVVQNVQNVLKGELNKPPLVMTSIPTIPGHDNSEWSNILPSILAGDVESNVNPDDHSENINPLEVALKDPVTISHPESFTPIKSEMYDTKPMIPVAVITVEQSSHEDKAQAINGSSVFHILNTLTSDKNIGQKFNQTVNDLESNKMAVVSVKPIGPTNSSCSMSSNCDHDVAIIEKPNGPSDVLAEKNKNHNVSEVDTVVMEIFSNKTSENHEEEKPKPVVTDFIDKVTQNPLKLDDEGKNKSEILEMTTNTIPSTATENLASTDEFKISTVANFNEITTANYPSLITLPTTVRNEVSTIKLNSSLMKEQIPVNVSSSIESQMETDLLNDDKKNVPIELDTLQTEKPGMISTDSLILSTIDNVSRKPPGIVSLSPESLNSSVVEDILRDDEKKLSTVMLSSPPTTIAPVTNGTFDTKVELAEKINSSLSPVNNSATSVKESPLPITTTPITPQVPSLNSVTRPSELIPSEIADSLSSMISQISQMSPSIISALENDYKLNNSTNETGVTEKINTQSTKNNETKLEMPSTTEKIIPIDNYKINQNASTLENSTVSDESKQKLEPNLQADEEFNENKKEIEKTPETPIVRIDIMETMPNVDKKTNVTLNKNNNSDVDNISNNNESTESPMVRIKLTDPLQMIHQILETPPVETSTINGFEELTLPADENIPANVIASGLIAGFYTNNNESSSKISNSTGAEIQEIAGNKTVEIVHKVTELSIAPNVTTVMTTDKQIEFEDITMIPSLSTHEIDKESISKLPIITTITTAIPEITTNLPKCSQNSSADQNINASCSLNNSATPENIKITQPQSTMSSNESTVSISNETMKVNMNTSDLITTELPEVRIDDNDTPVSQMPIKIQMDLQLPVAHTATTPATPETIKRQNVTEKPEVPSINNSTSSEHSLESKLNETVEGPQSLTPKLPDVMNAGVTSTKIKDKKKDDSRIEPLVKIESSTVSLKLNDTMKATPKPLKKNTTQETGSPQKWTLIPQELPHSNPQNVSTQIKNPLERISDVPKEKEKLPQINELSESKSGQGLDSSIAKLKPDIGYFSVVCNNLAFNLWNAVNSGLSTSRSLSLSPFGMTSILAMIYLGARSHTSDEMNEVIKLDHFTSFNPHLIFQNITDALSIAENQGIASVAFGRELFADQSKVSKFMNFYKKLVEQFYDGMVEKVNFSTISDGVKRKTNLFIRKQTGGRIRNFVTTNSIPLRPPLSVVSANVFQTDCNSATSTGRDGELYFAVSPAVRQRKLVLVPATVWKAGVLAGYEPSLDATAIAIGHSHNIVSTIYVIPGQHGSTASDDNLDLLEQRIISGALHDGAWNKLLKVIVPRPGLELQVPKFSHKSVINTTAALKTMGLEKLFLRSADFRGINGVGNDLYLGDVIQINLFSTCGDENIQSGKTKHHVETYPASPLAKGYESKYEDEVEEYDDEMNRNIFNSFKSTEGNSSWMRSSRETNDVNSKQRVKLDRPFLYFVRHNPTGMIIFMGRFNPHLLP